MLANDSLSVPDKRRLKFESFTRHHQSPVLGIVFGVSEKLSGATRLELCWPDLPIRFSA